MGVGRRILILGGGFGGIYAALELEKVLARREDSRSPSSRATTSSSSRRCCTTAEAYVRLRGAHRVLCAKLNHHTARRCIFHCNFGALGEV